MTFEEWADKYKPIKNWLSKDPDMDTFETYGLELGVVLGVNRFDQNKVWTLIEGDNGLWVTNGYHLVNRLNYFITEVPYEGGENDFMDVLYLEYDDEEDEDEEQEREWDERACALASAKTEEEVNKILGVKNED